MTIEYLAEDASPPVEALRAEPYSVSELDNVMNGARIWATVIALREHFTSEEREAELAATNRDTQGADAVKILRQTFDEFSEAPTKDNLKQVNHALTTLEELLEEK